jgi:hypothetical protein
MSTGGASAAGDGGNDVDASGAGDATTTLVSALLPAGGCSNHGSFSSSSAVIRFDGKCVNTPCNSFFIALSKLKCGCALSVATACKDHNNKNVDFPEMHVV